MTGTARNVAAEALATFLFVFSIVAAVNNAGDLAPLAIGFMLMALIFATGHISGGHLNPAVSLAAFLRGVIGFGEFLCYAIGQIIGGILAALLAGTIWSAPEGGALQIEAGPAFIVEALVTFILVYVILNVATSRDHPNNSFYGLAIGSTIVAGVALGGPVSGGGFNPAVSLSLALGGYFDWSNMWLYVLAPLVGSALAALAFRFLNIDDVIKKEQKAAA
ncbi:aquaporin Z [Leucobacter luti]|uniref:Aquaporin Z n=1 Tax=Leucobacter luti TaxID=340320 RepID=A0A4R6S6Z5_9MICO|nr:aquaporin [Leucobacter luti]TDP95570.1 aquaporin Z [Leucobacter luti]